MRLQRKGDSQKPPLFSSTGKNFPSRSQGCPRWKFSARTFSSAETGSSFKVRSRRSLNTTLHRTLSVFFIIGFPSKSKSQSKGRFWRWASSSSPSITLKAMDSVKRDERVPNPAKERIQFLERLIVCNAGVDSKFSTFSIWFPSCY